MWSGLIPYIAYVVWVHHDMFYLFVLPHMVSVLCQFVHTAHMVIENQHTLPMWSGCIMMCPTMCRMMCRVDSFGLHCPRCQDVSSYIARVVGAYRDMLCCPRDQYVSPYIAMWSERISHNAHVVGVYCHIVSMRSECITICCINLCGLHPQYVLHIVSMRSECITICCINLCGLHCQYVSHIVPMWSICITI